MDQEEKDAILELLRSLKIWFSASPRSQAEINAEARVLRAMEVMKNGPSDRDRR